MSDEQTSAKSWELIAAPSGTGDLFVSGWRPLVGWICAVCLLYAGLIEPLLRFIAVVVFGYAGTFPGVDNEILWEMLLGLLGLGGMRTVEKMRGVARDALKNTE